MQKIHRVFPVTGIEIGAASLLQPVPDA